MYKQKFSLVLPITLFFTNSAYSDNLSPQNNHCYQNYLRKLSSTLSENGGKDREISIVPMKVFSEVEVSTLIEPIFGSKWFLKAIDKLSHEGKFFTSRTEAHTLLKELSKYPQKQREKFSKSLLNELNNIIPVEVKIIPGKSIADQVADSGLSADIFEGVILHWKSVQNLSEEKFFNLFTRQLESRSNFIPIEIQSQKKWSDFFKFKVFSKKPLKEYERKIIEYIPEKPVPLNAVATELPKLIHSEQYVHRFSRYLSDEELKRLLDEALSREFSQSDLKRTVDVQTHNSWRKGYSAELRAGHSTELIKLLVSYGARITPTQLEHIKGIYQKLHLKNYLRYMHKAHYEGEEKFFRHLETEILLNWEALEYFRKNGHRARKYFDLEIPMDALELRPGLVLPDYSRALLYSIEPSMQDEFITQGIKNTLETVLMAPSLTTQEKDMAIIWYFGQLQHISKHSLISDYQIIKNLTSSHDPFDFNTTLAKYFQTTQRSPEETDFFFNLSSKLLQYVLEPTPPRAQEYNEILQKVFYSNNKKDS